MSDDMISQEEIDALLSGGGGDDAPADDAAASDDASAAGASPTGDTITDMERDALGEIGNISMVVRRRHSPSSLDARCQSRRRRSPSPT